MSQQKPPQTKGAAPKPAPAKETPQKPIFTDFASI